MKNKLETVIVLIDQIIVIAFTITLVVIIKNIIQDKATSAESMSETTIQVQQEPVSTSETAESTTSEQAVDEPSSEIEDTVSTSETAESTINEQTEISGETSEPESNSELQVDEPGTVSIDLDSDPDISSGLDGFADPDGWEPASDDEMAWALDFAEKNGTVLH